MIKYYTFIFEGDTMKNLKAVCFLLVLFAMGSYAQAGKAKDFLRPLSGLMYGGMDLEVMHDGTGESCHNPNGISRAIFDAIISAGARSAQSGDGIGFRFRVACVYEAGRLTHLLVGSVNLSPPFAAAAFVRSSLPEKQPTEIKLAAEAAKDLVRQFGQQWTPLKPPYRN